MIVSVGTGQHRPIRPEWAKHPARLAIWKAIHALTCLSYDTSQLAISVLQWLGASPQPWAINSEIGSLEDAAPGAPLWTFVRYDAPLELQWLAQHMDDPPPDDMLPEALPPRRRPHGAGALQHRPDGRRPPDQARALPRRLRPPAALEQQGLLFARRGKRRPTGPTQGASGARLLSKPP